MSGYAMASGDPRPPSDPAPQCAHCGGLIGLHEPAIRVVGGIASSTSRALEPEQSADPPGVLYHAVCYELSRRERD
jgi:hypothetical protein